MQNFAQRWNQTLPHTVPQLRQGTVGCFIEHTVCSISQARHPLTHALLLSQRPCHHLTTTASSSRQTADSSHVVAQCEGSLTPRGTDSKAKCKPSASNPLLKDQDTSHAGNQWRKPNFTGGREFPEEATQKSQKKMRWRTNCISPPCSSPSLRICHHTTQLLAAGTQGFKTSPRKTGSEEEEPALQSFLPFLTGGATLLAKRLDFASFYRLAEHRPPLAPVHLGAASGQNLIDSGSSYTEDLQHLESKHNTADINKPSAHRHCGVSWGKC